MGITYICLLMEKKPCLGSICNEFNALESTEPYLNGNVYDFSVDYNFVDKSGILNINKYLMTKNNLK